MFLLDTDMTDLVQRINADCTNGIATLKDQVQAINTQMKELSHKREKLQQQLAVLEQMQALATSGDYGAARRPSNDGTEAAASLRNDQQAASGSKDGKVESHISADAPQHDEDETEDETEDHNHKRQRDTEDDDLAPEDETENDNHKRQRDTEDDDLAPQSTQKKQRNPRRCFFCKQQQQNHTCKRFVKLSNHEGKIYSVGLTLENLVVLKWTDKDTLKCYTTKKIDFVVTTQNNIVCTFSNAQKISRSGKIEGKKENIEIATDEARAKTVREFLRENQKNAPQISIQWK